MRMTRPPSTRCNLLSDTLIWSGEHQAWWRYGDGRGNGYTVRLYEAGIWPFEEALRLTQHCGPDKKIKLLDAESIYRNDSLLTEFMRPRLAAERERCAKACERLALMTPDYSGMYCAAAKHCAVAIRALTDEDEEDV